MEKLKSDTINVWNLIWNHTGVFRTVYKTAKKKKRKKNTSWFTWSPRQTSIKCYKYEQFCNWPNTCRNCRTCCRQIKKKAAENKGTNKIMILALTQESTSGSLTVTVLKSCKEKYVRSACIFSSYLIQTDSTNPEKSQIRHSVNLMYVCPCIVI